MKTTYWMTLLMAGSLLAAAAPAQATGSNLSAEQGAETFEQRSHRRWQQGSGKPGPQTGWAGRHGWQQLNLTEAQKQQLRALRREHRAEAGTRAGQRAQHQQLRQLVQADSFDATAARLLLEQRQQAQLEQQLARLTFRHQVWQLLTDEQRALLQQRPGKRKPAATIKQGQPQRG